MRCPALLVLLLATLALTAPVRGQLGDPGRDLARGQPLDAGANPHAVPGSRPQLPQGAARVERLSDGTLSRITGTLNLDGRALGDRVATALATLGPGFGLEGSMVLGDPLVRNLADGGATVALEQRVHAAPVDGHGLWLRFDASGALRVMHGALSREAAALGPPIVSPLAARAIALDALAARLDLDLGSGNGLGNGLDPAHDGTGAPLAASVTQAVRFDIDGPLLVQRVELVHQLLPWRVDVDARTGSPTAIRELTSHGGTVESADASIAFDTGHGRGLVHTSVGAALAGRASPGRLAELALDDALFGMIEQHTLSGRYTSVSAADGWRLQEQLHGYRFHPLSFHTLGPHRVEHQLFDHVNTYAWINRAAAAYEPVADGPRLERSVRAYVNFDGMGLGYANAFFSPADPDGPGGQPPGYLVFGEFSNLTGDPRDDLSRDPSVVAHEVNHLVLHEQGLGFGDAAPHSPPRGLSEGLADFAAAQLLHDPRIGAVLVAHGEELGLTGAALRDLSVPLHLPTRLWEQVHKATGLPEEHHLGRLVGSALWTLRSTLGARATARLLGPALIDLPQHTAEVGYPVVTPADATEATRAYFAACGLALLERASLAPPPGRDPLGAVLGTLLTHGWLGDGLAPAAPLDARGDGLRALIPGAFIDGVTEHRIELVLDPGQRLSIDLRGRGVTTVDFDWGPLAESSDAISAGSPKSVSPKARRASQRDIVALAPVTLTLRVRDPSGEGGAYRLRLAVR